MRAALVATLVLLAASAASATEVPTVLMDMPTGIPPPPGSYKPCPPVVLELDKAGAAKVNGKAVARRDLGKVLVSAISRTDGCERVFISPDPDTPYGEVLMVISLIKQAGIFRIGLIDTAYEEDR